MPSPCPRLDDIFRPVSDGEWGRYTTLENGMTLTYRQVHGDYVLRQVKKDLLKYLIHILIKLKGTTMIKITIIMAAVSLFGLFCLPMPASFASNHNKKAKIQWSSEKLEIRAERGESLSMDVQFVSKSSLSKVYVWVVPELQPFISVTQSYFAKISKGSTCSVKMEISIPYNTENGLCKGTIHLRKKHKVKDDGSSIKYKNEMSKNNSRTFPEALNIELSIVDDDDDGDGYTDNQGDCDDKDPTINPDKKEVCDSVDNNCDGQIDEPEIHITYPADGSTVNSTDTIVKGIVNSCSQEVGIIINGVYAEIAGSEFAANYILLETDVNTLTAVARDVGGHTTRETITVYTNENEDQVRLSSNITSGISPLDVRFSIYTQKSNQIRTYEMDFDGDGVIDQTIADPDNVSFIYNREGIYYPTITIRDDEGNKYSDSMAINVLSQNELNTLLTGMRSEVINLLRLQDIKGALSYFVESSRPKYEEGFRLLFDQLPEIFSIPQELFLISIIDNIATYINAVYEEGITRAYPVVFIKDENGFWKISTF